MRFGRTRAKLWNEDLDHILEDDRAFPRDSALFIVSDNPAERPHFNADPSFRGVFSAEVASETTRFEELKSLVDQLKDLRRRLSKESARLRESRRAIRDEQAKLRADRQRARADRERAQVLIKCVGCAKALPLTEFKKLRSGEELEPGQRFQECFDCRARVIQCRTCHRAQSQRNFQVMPDGSWISRETILSLYDRYKLSPPAGVNLDAARFLDCLACRREQERAA